MKRDFSKVPATVTITNDTDNKVILELSDLSGIFEQVPATIESGQELVLTVKLSEALAALTHRVEDAGIKMTVTESGGDTPEPEPEEPTEVTDIDSLKEAITSGAEQVKLTDNISVESGNLDITGVKNFDGNGKTITFNTTGQNFVAMQDATIENVTVENAVADDNWSSTYGVQCYNGTYTLKNVTSKGGNAGILVNSANVTLEGTIDVSDNAFGGIEVSKSSNPDMANSTLNVNGATIVNTSEAYGKPTIWTDGEGQTVTGVENMFANSTVKEGQVQYYLTEENSKDIISDLDLTGSVKAACDKYYNKFSNETIDSANENFDEATLYVDLGNVVSTDATNITVNDQDYDNSDVSISIGNNAFVKAPLWKVQDSKLLVSIFLLGLETATDEITITYGDNVKTIKGVEGVPATELPITEVLALNTQEGYTNNIETSDNNKVITQTTGFGSQAVGVVLQADGEDILDTSTVILYKAGNYIGISTPETMGEDTVTFAFYGKYSTGAYTEEDTRTFDFTLLVPDKGIAQFNLTVKCIVETVEEESTQEI